MLHLIDNQKMRVVATSPDMGFLEEHARDLPRFTDFMIIEAKKHHLIAFTMKNLRLLYRGLGGQRNPGRYDRNQLETLVVSSLAGLEPVSEPPPAKAERHTIIPDGHYANGDSLEDRRNEMANAKKTASKKSASKKAPEKKATSKKTASKKTTSKKVERERQNGVLRPLPGSKKAAVWDIADKLSEKAGEPAQRSDIMEEVVKDKSLSPAGASADYQSWRKFHGLVKRA